MENLNPDPQAPIEPLFSSDAIDLSLAKQESSRAHESAADTAGTPAEQPTATSAPTRELGTYELLRSPGRNDSAADDNDVTAEILSRPRRSVWDC